MNTVPNNANGGKLPPHRGGEFLVDLLDLAASSDREAAAKFAPSWGWPNGRPPHEFRRATCLALVAMKAVHRLDPDDNRDAEAMWDLAEQVTHALDALLHGDSKKGGGG